jgi:Bacterial protein of unknown function (DUF899)
MAPHSSAATMVDVQLDLFDDIDGPRQHLEHHDVRIVAVSRAPLAKLLAYKRRMGWRFDWVSSFGSDFNYDFHVSFTQDQVTRGRVDYNFSTITDDARYHSEELPAVSVFYKKSGRAGLPYLLDLRAGPRRPTRRRSLSRPYTEGAVRGGLPELAAPSRRVRARGAPLGRIICRASGLMASPGWARSQHTEQARHFQRARS